MARWRVAVGALAAGLLADALGIPAAIWAVAALTAAPGVLVAVRMYEAHPREPVTQAASVLTSRAVGLTSQRPPISTVGTVSVPPAAARIAAAASGVRQMSTSVNDTPRRRRPTRNRWQYPHPARV